MSFEDISRILYTHWVFLILAVYISGGFTYLIYRKLPAYNGKAVKLFALTIVGGLLLFYFVLPVPVEVQDKFIQTVQSFKKDNKAFKDTYIQLTKRKVCRNKYLNAYGYFQLKNSFMKDQDEAFKAQGSLSFSANDQDSKTYKYICE